MEPKLILCNKVFAPRVSVFNPRQIIKNPFNKRLQNIPISPHIQFLAPENDFWLVRLR